MTTPQISVIIPVYNAEKCLHRCIDSILLQTYIDFELLLIDDGSTDSSGIICDGYATQDSRIRVFHKSNGGVSSARNLGLDNALGEWVCFIDSDDEIRNLESLCISQSKSDVILFTLRMIDGNGMSYSDPLMAFSGASDIKENYLKAYLHFHIFNSVCAKLIRRSAIKDLRFDSTVKFGEDALFNLRLMKFVEKIAVCDTVVYTYYRTEDYGIKYQASIESSVNTMKQIFDAYWMLGCRNRTFERNVFNCYRAICREEWMKKPSLWNNNKAVATIYSEIKDAYPLGFRTKYRLVPTCVSRLRQKLKGIIDFTKNNKRSSDE